jgi:hypothetical protein
VSRIGIALVCACAVLALAGTGYLLARLVWFAAGWL